MQQKIELQDGSNDKKYFTIIPNYILNHSTLYDREVYIQMKRIAGEQGRCWTSQKTLADQCGISINRLKKSIKYLIDHEWIKPNGTKRVETSGGSQQVNEYKITDLWNLNNKYYQDKGVSPNDIPIDKGVSPGDTKGYHESGKGVSPGDDKEDHSNNITIKNRENKFSPPSLEEVKQYCNERNNGVSAEQFINFYESKGWLIGKNKMKSWQAAVRTWENRNRAETSGNVELPEYAKKYIK